MSNVRLAQLYSLRAQVEALIALEEADIVAVQAAAGCSHPEEKRRDASSLGGEHQYLCLACGETVPGVA